MGKFDEQRENALREKYNFPDGKLKYEHGRNFPKVVNETAENRHFVRYINDLKNKFQMEGLELEGAESLKPKESAEFFEKAEKAEVKDLKLACGATMFRGKKIGVWFLRTKP